MTGGMLLPTLLVQLIALGVLSLWSLLTTETSSAFTPCSVLGAWLEISDHLFFFGGGEVGWGYHFYSSLHYVCGISKWTKSSFRNFLCNCSCLLS